MNRINQLFEKKKKGILSLYFCAGHPTLEGTVEVIKTLASNGIDMIEVGIPFSDPMADGPVIQDAATKALKNVLKKLSILHVPPVRARAPSAGTVLMMR